MTSDETEELFWEGLKLAKQGRAAEAFGIAKTLKAHRYTGTFEVEAVALHEIGRADEAIEVLREGLDASRVWRLGHLLGIYLSDEGRYDEALDAFDECHTMEFAEPVATATNRAIVLNRAGRTEEAVASLQELLAGDLPADEAGAAEFARNYLADLTDAPRPAAPRRRTTKRRIAFRKR